MSFLCPDCRSCQISSMDQRCGSNSVLQAEAMSGKSAALARYNSAVPDMHRIYINSTFNEKDTVKRMGARWDAARKTWYIDGRRGNEFIAKFSKWLRKTTKAVTVQVPYEDETKAPVISFDELSAAIAWADQASAPAATIREQVQVTNPAEKEYVSRTIQRNASYR